MPSMFSPEMVESQVKALLADQMPTVNVASASPADFDDEGTLIANPPCVRTSMRGGQYNGWEGDNQRLVYTAVEHDLCIWCVDESLRSTEDQREKSKVVLGQVIQLLSGARIVLTDGSKSEPLRIVSYENVVVSQFGVGYLLIVKVPGIAQLPGPNA